MEFSNGSERWEDEQLHTLELALGFPPGTITLADIEYLIQRSCAESDDSEDDDLCFSMQYCQVSPPPFFCLPYGHCNIAKPFTSSPSFVAWANERQQIGGDSGITRPYGSKSSRKESLSSSSSSKSSSSSSSRSHSSRTSSTNTARALDSSSSSDHKRTSRSTTQKAERSRDHHHRRR